MDDNNCFTNIIYALFLLQLIVSALVLTLIYAQYITERKVDNQERKIRRLQQAAGNQSFISSFCFSFLTFYFSYFKYLFLKKCVEKRDYSEKIRANTILFL